MEQIYPFWFPQNQKYQKWWFQSKTNSDSVLKVHSFLQQLPSFQYNDFLKNPANCLSGILLYDQMYRHIGENDNEKIAIAMNLAYYAFQKDWLDSYQPHEVVFALLPFRHTNHPTCLAFCSSYLSTRNDKENSHIRRFMNALTKQMQNQVPRTCIYLNDVVDYKSKLMYHSWKDILCDKEIYIFSPNFVITKSLAYTTLSKFIQSDNDISSGKKKFVISLSGGVDSMVCLHLCILYQQTHPTFRFSAVHLNWNQREESTREMDFLIEYARRNKVELITRNITHLSRKENRTFFESETRRIRFALYQQVLEGEDGVIFMGHHRGDIVENVFTNMIRGVNYLDLGKMKVQQVMHDITIVRPFLTIPKSSILEVAKKAMIPFFKDTTPDWSNRGAVRRRIFPIIESQFANSYETGFLRMAEKSSQMRVLIHQCLLEPYIKSIQTPAENELLLKIENDYPLIFYELVFEQLCHRMGVKRMSMKSLQHWYSNSILTQKEKWTYSFGKNMTLTKVSNDFMKLTFLN